MNNDPSPDQTEYERVQRERDLDAQEARAVRLERFGWGLEGMQTETAPPLLPETETTKETP
jgi:hypothetical protein